MVEFGFDLKPLFPKEILRVTSNMMQIDDHRRAPDFTTKMSEIINKLGDLSAKAQKLRYNITSAQLFRKSVDQVIYLMADVNAGPNGRVLGYLKIGTKDLFLVDERGTYYKKKYGTPCILDFYVHESRQRSGLGKQLLETVLAEEKLLPVKCAMDRPSHQLICFLKKHYSLDHNIQQPNNFVIYEGFFETPNLSENEVVTSKRNQINSSTAVIRQQAPVRFTGTECYRNKMRDVNGRSTMEHPNKGLCDALNPQCSMAEVLNHGFNARY